MGNIYTSDTVMEMFGLSQRRTFRPHNFAVDFMRVAVNVSHFAQASAIKSLGRTISHPLKAACHGACRGCLAH